MLTQNVCTVHMCMHGAIMGYTVSVHKCTSAIKYERYIWQMQTICHLQLLVDQLVQICIITLVFCL